MFQQVVVSREKNKSHRKLKLYCGFHMGMQPKFIAPKS